MAVTDGPWPEGPNDDDGGDRGKPDDIIGDDDGDDVIVGPASLTVTGNEAATWCVVPAAPSDGLSGWVLASATASSNSLAVAENICCHCVNT